MTKPDSTPEMPIPYWPHVLSRCTKCGKEWIYDLRERFGVPRAVCPECEAAPAAPEPPQLPYAADWEPLWTVCSNLESILLREPRQDFPEAFHANLKRAFALLRERYALPPSPNATPEGLIGDDYHQAPAPTAEGPREGLESWDIDALLRSKRCRHTEREDEDEDGVCDAQYVHIGEGATELAKMIKQEHNAALERAAQIAEERVFKHVGTDFERGVSAAASLIAAEIRKLAKEMK